TTQAAAIVAAEATAPAAAAAQPAITPALNTAHAAPARPSAMPTAASALMILSPCVLKNRYALTAEIATLRAKPSIAYAALTALSATTPNAFSIPSAKACASGLVLSNMPTRIATASSTGS